MNRAYPVYHKSQFKSFESQRLAVIPPVRSARHAAMIEYLNRRDGQFHLDARSFNELRECGFDRSRAEQTVEELAEAGKLVVRGETIVTVETPARAALSETRGRAN